MLYLSLFSLLLCAGSCADCVLASAGGSSVVSTPSRSRSDRTASTISDNKNVDAHHHSDSISVVLNNMMVELDHHVSSLLDSPRTFRNDNFVGDQQFEPPPIGFLEGHVHYDLVADTLVDMDIKRGLLVRSGIADTMLAANDEDALDEVHGYNVLLDTSDEDCGNQLEDTMLAANDEVVLADVSEGDGLYVEL